MDALIGVLVGALLATLGALATQRLSHHHDDRTRWSHERWLAIGEVASVAARLEGLNYRRGRARADDGRSDLIEERDESAREGLNLLYATMAKASLLLPSLRSDFDRLRETERRMRDLTDAPLPGRTAEWKAAREAHQDQIEVIGSKCRQILGVDE